jgi:hypothetical protein
MTTRIQQSRPKIPISPNNRAIQSPDPILDLDKERRIHLEFAIVQVTFLFIAQIQEHT